MIERYFKGVQPHTHLAELDAEIALLPGPPERAAKIAQHFSAGERVTAQREFVTYRGEFKGKNVCVTSTGVGCPSAAIVVEELANCGVTQFIRVGTTGTIQEQVALGDLILPDAAVRDDGTTREYVGNGDLAGANSEIVAALRKAADAANVNYHVGTVPTNDAFYGTHDFQRVLQRYQQLGVLSFEMECAAIFTVAELRGLRAGGFWPLLVIWLKMSTRIRMRGWNRALADTKRRPKQR